MGTSFNNIIFAYLDFHKWWFFGHSGNLKRKTFERPEVKCLTENMFCVPGLPTLCQFWKRQAPEKDNDPFNKIFRIMDM